MNLKQVLVGELIGVARACNMHPKTENTTKILIYALLAVHPLADTSEEDLQEMIQIVQEEKGKIAPGCSTCQAKCGNTDSYDLSRIDEENPEVRNLKQEILEKLYEYAMEISDIYMEGRLRKEQESYLYRALCAVSYDMDPSRYQDILKEM